MNKFGTQTPYLASYVIVRKNGKVAFVMRSNTNWMNGYYGLPSGKVENHESCGAAAVREAMEEIGITVKESDLRFVHTIHRHHETDWIDMFYEVTAYEGELVNAEPHMHSELAWLDPDNLPDNVMEYVRFALERIAAGKTYTEYGWDS